MVLSCVTAISLLTVVFMSLGVVVFMLQRKTQAQSICIRTNVRLLNELGESLRELMKLNRRARQLMRARKFAEKILRVARLTRYPPAIAVAEGGLRAVQGLQMVLAAKQSAIRARAEWTRLRYRRELSTAIRAVAGFKPQHQSGGTAALAVAPHPRTEIAPEYRPVAGFARRQAQTMQFEVRLTPGLMPEEVKIEQSTSCVVTLVKEKTRWRPKIIAASARSNSPSWRSRWSPF